MPALVPTLAEIERLGFDYTEVAQYDLEQLSKERRVQVREPNHYAPPDAVARFSVQMGQSEFPHIVVTSDGWIVDGNTRVGAALVRKQKFYPALVLNVDMSKATTKTQNELYALGATLNAQNGTPLTAREIRSVSRRFVELGWKNDQIARAIGVKPASVAGVKRELDAEAKLNRVGLTTNGPLKGASLRAIGSKEALSLNDVPFKTLATLAGEAGLNASEIVSIAKEAKDKGADTAAVDHLQAVRQEMGDRIRQRELTGTGKPPVARQLRQHLGFVTAFAGRERELIEKNAGVVAQHTEALTQSLAILEEVLKLQALSRYEA